jgi:hypothetical protein
MMVWLVFFHRTLLRRGYEGQEDAEVAEGKEIYDD